MLSCRRRGGVGPCHDYYLTPSMGVWKVLRMTMTMDRITVSVHGRLTRPRVGELGGVLGGRSRYVYKNLSRSQMHGVGLRSVRVTITIQGSG